MLNDWIGHIEEWHCLSTLCTLFPISMIFTGQGVKPSAIHVGLNCPSTGCQFFLVRRAKTGKVESNWWIAFKVPNELVEQRFRLIQRWENVFEQSWPLTCHGPWGADSPRPTVLLLSLSMGSSIEHGWKPFVGHLATVQSWPKETVASITGLPLTCKEWKLRITSDTQILGRWKRWKGIVTGAAGVGVDVFLPTDRKRERGSERRRERSQSKKELQKANLQETAAIPKNPESAWLEVKKPKRQIARRISGSFAVVQRTQQRIHKEFTCGSATRTWIQRASWNYEGRANHCVNASDARWNATPW